MAAHSSILAWRIPGSDLAATASMSRVRLGAILFLKMFVYLFIFDGAESWLLSMDFSSCGKQAYFAVVVCRLIAMPSLLAERGLQGAWASAVVAQVGPRLQGIGSIVVGQELSCSAAFGIFPDLGSSRNLLH